MCCRIVYDQNEEIRKTLLKRLRIINDDQLNLEPNFNAPPGTFLPIIYLDSLVVKANLVEWGLVPTWSKDRKTKFANAKAETIDTKYSFKEAFKQKRCIVPVSGYYEWKLENGVKQPYYIHDADSKVLALAGLYDNDSFTIITIAAKGKLLDIHHRMPLILDERYWDGWLQNYALTEQEFEAIIQTSHDSIPRLTISRVTREVNNTINNRKELIEDSNT